MRVYFSGEFACGILTSSKLTHKSFKIKIGQGDCCVHLSTQGSGQRSSMVIWVLLVLRVMVVVGILMLSNAFRQPFNTRQTQKLIIYLRQLV